MPHDVAHLDHLCVESLNSECFCVSLDHDALYAALGSEIGTSGLFDLVQQCCP